MLAISTTEPRLFFRADGSPTIGLGHIVRTLALANWLRGLAPGTFLLRQPAPAVAALVVAEGWALHLLPTPADSLTEADYLASNVLQPGDVLVLDGYEFGADYQRRLRASGCRLLLLDDPPARAAVADAVLNHSPGVTSADYPAILPGNRLLLGPAYSLLRRPFQDAAALPAPPRPIESVLVCFGGADPLGLTARALAELRKLPGLHRVGLVVGAAFGPLPALQAAAAEPGTPASLYMQVPAPELVYLLQTHDAVLAPASTVLIEALVLGRPTLTGYYAANQQALAKYVATHHQAYSLGNLAAELGATALHQGLRWLETTLRQPYAEALHPQDVRATVRELLGSESSA